MEEANDRESRDIITASRNPPSLETFELGTARQGFFSSFKAEID